MSGPGRCRFPIGRKSSSVSTVHRLGFKSASGPGGVVVERVGGEGTVH